MIYALVDFDSCKYTPSMEVQLGHGSQQLPWHLIGARISGAVVLDLTSLLDDLEETFGFWCSFPWNDCGPASEAICFEMAHVERYNMSCATQVSLGTVFFWFWSWSQRKGFSVGLTCWIILGRRAPVSFAQETRLELLQKLSEMIGTFS